MSETNFPRFLEIATGPVFEVVSQCFVGGRHGFLNEQNFRAMYAAAGKSAACSADYENRSSPRKVVRVVLEPPTINSQL